MLHWSWSQRDLTKLHSTIDEGDNVNAWAATSKRRDKGDNEVEDIKQNFSRNSQKDLANMGVI